MIAQCFASAILVDFLNPFTNDYYQFYQLCKSNKPGNILETVASFLPSPNTQTLLWCLILLNCILIAVTKIAINTLANSTVKWFKIFSESQMLYFNSPSGPCFQKYPEI